MKKTVATFAAMAALAGPAFAADLPAYKAPVSAAPAPFDWTGFYAGAHGGYGWGKHTSQEEIAFSRLSLNSKPAGGFGGAQVGYNWQFAPHWLIGSEIDLSFSDVAANLSSTPAEYRFDMFGTARTRFGYVQDRTLVYGTFGAIWLRDKLSVSVPGNYWLHTTDYHVGRVLGGGFEYAFDPRWTFKFEYLYASFDENLSSPLHVSHPGLQTIRAGLNYRFGETDAPAASMPAKTVARRSDWNGSYIGLHGGYGWANLDWTASGEAFGVPLPATISTARPDGFFGGIQGGYNWVVAPQWLLGIEIDASFGDLKNTGHRLNVSGGAVLDDDPVIGKIDRMGTARLRIGTFVTPDTLIYATGGAAYARAKMEGPVSNRLDRFGWIAGGGAEWKFAADWSLKLEYDYTDLGGLETDLDWPGAQVGARSKNDLTLQTVKIGFNYYGPVIERLFGGK